MKGHGNYPPVIRPEATGSRNVTWGECIEAGFLRSYRQEGVPLQRIRPVVDLLREQLGVPYPLAHAKPLVGPGRRLFLEAQDEVNLGKHPLVYEAVSRQLLLSPRSSSLSAGLIAPRRARKNRGRSAGTPLAGSRRS